MDALNICLPQQTRDLSITLTFKIARSCRQLSLKVTDIRCGVDLGGGGASGVELASVKVGSEARHELCSNAADNGS